MLPRCTMAIMATEAATSSKKPGSHESRDERDATRARPGAAGKTPGDKGSPKPPSADPETLDDELEDPYDNVACTD